MNDIYDGGTAFPTEYNDRGLTMRDYFAAAALQGWLASWPEQGTPHPSENYNALNVANLSYRLADAMLAARKEANDQH